MHHLVGSSHPKSIEHSWKWKNNTTEAILRYFESVNSEIDNDAVIRTNKNSKHCKARCLLCDPTAAPKSYTKGNTSNLKKHLKRV